MTDPTTTTLRLPIAHAQDWLSRCAEEGATVVEQTARTITLELDDTNLQDMISDATYYAECMGPEETGDADYRPKARTLLRALERLGVEYDTRPGTYVVTLRR